MDDRKDKKTLNDANNTIALRKAADIASQTNHPYAKAIGTGVKIADKLTDGKTTEKLGNLVTKYNQMNGIKGKISQFAINKLSKETTSTRIASATNKNKMFYDISKNNQISAFDQNTQNKEKLDEQPPEVNENNNAGGMNFKVSIKLIKWTLLIGVPVFSLYVFCSLFIPATQAFLTVNKLGQADDSTDGDIEPKLDDTENYDEEITDDTIGDEAFNFKSNNYEFVLDNSLKESNIVFIARRARQEASVSDLEDFYPNIRNYVDEDGKITNIAKTFFFKMYHIYNFYLDNYNVELNMAIIMATLNLQSTDIEEVFSSNIEGYKLTERDGKLIGDEKYAETYFDIDYDWTNYHPTRTYSAHDIEVLAQHMVVKDGSETENSKEFYKIKDVPILDQNKSGLYTGCETTSAVMLMKYYELTIDEKTFVDEYLIKKDIETKNNITYGPDPNSAFVGSPYDSNSYGIYSPAMAKSMNKFLKDKGYKAISLKDKKLNELCDEYISKDIPVMIWATIDMKETSEGNNWFINYVDENAKYKKGDKFVWTRPEHCLLLIGYDENYYYFNDPNLGKEVKYSRSTVENRYKSLGSQAIIIEEE